MARTNTQTRNKPHLTVYICRWLPGCWLVRVSCYVIMSPRDVTTILTYYVNILIPLGMVKCLYNTWPVFPSPPGPVTHDYLHCFFVRVLLAYKVITVNRIIITFHDNSNKLCLSYWSLNIFNLVKCTLQLQHITHKAL